MDNFDGNLITVSVVSYTKHNHQSHKLLSELSDKV